ncbi:MAG: hypothetical protein ABR505_02540 [Actinomycetota bacterium]
MLRRFIVGVIFASALVPLTAATSHAGPIPCGKIVIRNVYVANIPCIFEEP